MKWKIISNGHEYVITKLPSGRYAVSWEDTRENLPRNIFKSLNDMLSHYPNLRKHENKFKEGG